MSKTIAIPPGYRRNFQTMLLAAKYHDLALVSCVDKATQKPVMAVCAMQRNEDGTITPMPFARMFDGNPFELLEDPTIP